MFNMYTKLTTALGAFALLISGGAWGQCADGEIAIDYAISNGSYPSEISWQLNDASGENIFTGGAGEAGTWCLAPGDYTFIGIDSFGDGWNGASAEFYNSGALIGELAVEGGQGSVVLTVSADVPGCTDPAAGNYNPAATVDDGSCCLGNVLTFNLSDAFGDGWSFGSGGAWGGIILNGTDSVEFASGSALSFDVCAEEGCYTAQISMGAWGQEASWEVVQNGVVLNSGSGAGGSGTTFDADFFYYAGSGDCVVYGCAVEIACNYNPGANLDDGSCEYVSCAGCADEGACNYEGATLDDGSCDYSCIGCLDATATNYCADCTIDSEDCAYCEGAFAGILTVGGGTWDSEISWTLANSDSALATGGAPSETALCLDAGCYTFSMADAFGDGWNGATYTFSDYDGNVILEGDIDDAASGDGSSEGVDYLDFDGGCTSGCTDAGACNYDADADFNDDSCDYSCVGCQDSSAANYDPNATLPGDCIYCDPGTFILTVDMFDSFGDGWSGSEYYIYSLETGALEDSGSLGTAFTGDGLTVGTDYVCLAPGCYNFQVLDDTWPGEVSIDLSDQFGTSYATVGAASDYGLDFTLTGQCGFEGCTDPAGVNFDPSATVDDGTCGYPPSNDEVGDAEALACGLSVSGSLENASDGEGLEGFEFGNEVLSAGDVWYVINSEVDQQITISTCDTPANDFDAGTDYATNTNLAIFTQDISGALSGIATNGDGCGTGLHSSVTWSAMTGMDYYIRVEGTGGNDFVISASCDDSVTTSPSNDNCDGATAQVTGETFVGSLCGANAEEIELGWEGTGTAYAVYFTFNSANYNTFFFNATNLTNESIGFAMLEGSTCDDLTGFVGCVVTGTCAGSVEGFLPNLEPDTDYYFVIWTDDQSTCGEFEFTTTGIILGCTDSTANNYNAEANQDDGSCDFAGVTPVNDTCEDAIALECNTVTTGSTGGSTNAGSPLGLAGCDNAPGAGVWYSFVGDGQLHTLSTCGSAIDSKINIFTADTACGGGGIDAPPADACGEGLVTTSYSVGGGSWDSEISWYLIGAAGDTALSGGAPSTGSICLPAGDYTLSMIDAYADGWNGAGATFTNGLGDVMGFAGLETGGEGSATISIAPYSTEPTYIAGDFECFDSAISSDGTGECTLFDSDDVNFEFVSTPGLLYYVYVGAQDADGNPATDDNGAFDLSFTCAPVVEGCTDTAACNYDETANVEDGSCDIWSCVCDTETGTPVQFYMYDSFGDGWNGSEYTITSLAGDVVASGTLDDAAFFVDDDNSAGPEFGYDLVCLEPGCYSVSVTEGDWPSEVSWEVLTEDGSVLTTGGPTDGITISVGGAVCGCTDAGACNYDETATDEDGSCEYETCAGCLDNTACNYDAEALIDDGSCCYDNCVTINMADSFGDGWNGAVYELSSVDGTAIGSGTIEAGSNAADTYCLSNGCYSITVTEGDWPGEISWNISGAFGGIVQGGAGESVTFNVGSGDACVEGCGIPTACNYDAATNISNVELCVFDGCSGCTYQTATNYDEGAVIDDGSCNFEIANPCPADLNGDGSVSTADLLEFLTAFGQEC